MSGPVPAIELEHVSRWYGNVVAVNDISFALGPGVTGLLGPNGAGKSTLLHLLSGLLAPSAGAARIEGRPAFGDPSVYRHVGLVPEREAVPGYLTGYGFVRLNADLQGMSDAEAATERAIATVELTEAAHRRLSTYSKGMRQRAKLAAALVHDPRILLLDEPFNGMDPRQRLHMMGLLRQMAAAGRVILFSSHILEEVERLADAVLVVYAGRLAASGDFRSIRRLMTDRPHRFTIRSSDDRALAAALLAPAGRLRRRARRRPARRPHLRLRRLHAHRRPDRAHRRHPAPRGQADRRLPRKRVRLPRAKQPMTAFGALVAVTLRGLLGRRRTLLMVLLACLPILVGLLIRLGGGRNDAPEILDALVIRTVLPLIALVFGTAAIGSEIEDGTAVYLLAKPIARWRIALAKLGVAAGLTAALVVPPIVLTGLLVEGFGGESLATAVGFALAAIAGGTAYAVAFSALGVITSRALVVGLGYTLLWEGVLAGLLDGTRFLSIRQGTLGVAAALTGEDIGNNVLGPAISALILGVVLVGGFLLTTRALMRFQIRSAD